MTAAQILKEFGWTQGAYARNSAGYTTSTQSPDATRFCLIGALLKAYPGSTEPYYEARQKLILALEGSLALVAFNDAEGRTAAEVIALCEKAGV